MTQFTRRQFALATAATLAPALGRAQSPNLGKIVAAFPAGGSIDMISRQLAEQLRGVWATTVVVDNKSGVGGRLAVNDIKAGPADGTVMMVNAGGILTVYPHTAKVLGYRPFEDVTAISLTNMIEYGFAVGPLVPESVKNLKDYFAWARTDRKNQIFASTAPLSPVQFTGQLLGRAAGVELEPVQYRGSTPAVLDLISGQVPAIASPLNDLLSNFKAGKLRLLGTSGRKRSAQTSQIATFAEQGFSGLPVADWFGVFVHGKTPMVIQQRLSAQVRKALRAPALVQAFAAVGLEPVGSTPEEVTKLAHVDFDQWARTVKTLGIQPE